MLLQPTHKFVNLVSWFMTKRLVVFLKLNYFLLAITIGESSFSKIKARELHTIETRVALYLQNIKHNISIIRARTRFFDTL